MAVLDLKSYFCGMKDPRIDRRKVHKMEDLIFISIACVLCGGESWYDMELYCELKYDWLKTFLELPGGIPSHDTFNRFFSALCPKEFEQCFIKWTNSIVQRTNGEVISIDGKTMRRTKGSENPAVHIVSAWADSNNIVLGQLKTEQKSNEITAIPELLKLLMIESCIITIDAMGCQREIASQIIEQKGDYVLALKGNQGNLLKEVEDSFKTLKYDTMSEELDMGHGRVETRKCSVISDLQLIENKEQWSGLKSVARIESERYFKVNGKIETEIRYYICSIENAQTINKAVRKHWGVENKLHWTLDMSFHEDYIRTRTKYAAQNFAMLNKICLNLLKNDSLKASIKGKRKAAGWENSYLLQLIKF
jgi:predicted transposase YbfD/YdcC